nr:disease resistance protein RPM1-like [Ziziphus jujuba var. spinosa]
MEVLAGVLGAVETVKLISEVTLTLLNRERNNDYGAEESAREAIKDLATWLSTFKAVLHPRFDLGYRRRIGPIHVRCSSSLPYLETPAGVAQAGWDQDSSGAAGTSSSTPQQTWTHNIVEEEEMVGFKRHQEEIMNQLMNTDVMNCATILVVGHGGSGKTFLVKNIYRNKQVKEKFDCHAWVNVSPSYNVNSLVLKMFKQFCPGKSEQYMSLDQGVAMIEEKLGSYLEDKRYLVVLDDVWSKQGSFIPLANVLPINNNGSRIIVTARKNEVANAHYTHELHGLSQEEAWDLFCRTAFRNRERVCPHKELMSTSWKIINRCEGLPLVIAQVGSLLSHKQKVQTEWDEFYKRFDYEIRAESDIPIIERILLPTFEDLPDNLKSCFLYLSLFPKGYLIKRGRLIRSWMAEGFVEEELGKPLEDVSETYLNILIGRKLIQVSEWEIDRRQRRVRSFTVSSLFHEFLVSISKKRRYLTLPQPNHSASSSEHVRHISVQNVTTTDLKRVTELSKVRTFFMLGQQQQQEGASISGSSSSSHRFIGKAVFRRTAGDSLENVSENFKLLKVLDMQYTPLKDFPKDIERLVLLRCLNLSHTQVQEVPRSIKKLVFLETLNLKRTRVTNLPKGIYKLRRLHHLLVSYYDVEEQGVELSKRITILSSLQELSLVRVNSETKTMKNIGNLKELRKLRLKMKSLSTLDVRAKTENESVYLDYDMEEPPQIQRLYLKGRLDWLPRCISQLQSLVKVGLNGSKLNANVKPVEAFEDLPSLMELEMVKYYTGKELVFRAGKFKSLKILHIEEFDELSEVVVENYAIPKLEKLTICKCKKLKSVPLGIFDRKQPVEFLVYDMNEEFISNLQRGNKAKSYQQDLEPGIGSSQYYY